MPINPEAIERFLRDCPEPPIRVKGKPVPWLIDQLEAEAGAPYQPLTVPRPLQLEAVTFGAYQRCSLLFAKPRLGKSKAFLDWASIMRAGGHWQRKGLLIVPSPIVLSVWEGEAEKHSHLKLTIARLKLDELEDALESDADLIAASWSGLQQMFTRKVYDTKKKRNRMQVDYDLIRDFATEFDLCGIDEIHTCKNAASLRFKMAAELGSECSLFMGLTGTPHGRNPFDLWAQAFLCDHGKTLGRNFFFFQHAFGKRKRNWFSRSGYQWVFDQAKMPALNRRIAAISLSYGWEGNLDLPEIVRNEVRLPLTEEQQTYYDNALRKLLKLHMADKRAIDSIFIRLRQISSGFIGYLDDEKEKQITHLESCSKLAWIEEFLAEAPPDAFVALFHEFTETGRIICAHLGKLGIKHSWLWGGSKDRNAALKAYQTGKVHVLVINNAVGNMAIDLSCTDYMAFIESPVSATIREQAEARPMAEARQGKILFMDDLICSPVEERILRYAKEGKSLLSNLIFQEARAGLFDRQAAEGRKPIKKRPPVILPGGI